MVVLETEKSDREIVKDAISENLDIVYTNALMGSQLLKQGWRPIIGRSQQINPVILGLRDSGINKPEDLKNKKIMGSLGATVSLYTQYSLIKDNILDPNKLDNFIIKKVSQQQLLDILKTKQVDGIVVRDFLAKKLVDENPQIYKVLYTSQSSPGHMVFVSPKIDENKKALLKTSLLQLTPEDPYFKYILSGIDSYNEKDIHPFKEVSEKDVQQSLEVFKVLGEKPIE